MEEEKKECSPANEHAIVKEERDVGGEDDANEHVVAKKYTNGEENGDLVVKNNFLCNFVFNTKLNVIILYFFTI